MLDNQFIDHSNSFIEKLGRMLAPYDYVSIHGADKPLMISHTRTLEALANS